MGLPRHRPSRRRAAGSRLLCEFLRFLFREADSFANSFRLSSRNRHLLQIPPVFSPGSQLCWKFYTSFFQEAGSYVNSFGFFSGKLTLLRIPSSFPPGTGISCKFLSGYFPGRCLACKFSLAFFQEPSSFANSFHINPSHLG